MKLSNLIMFSNDMTLNDTLGSKCLYRIRFVFFIFAILKHRLVETFAPLSLVECVCVVAHVWLCE